MDEPLTREAFTQQYGFDPESDAVPAVVTPAKPQQNRNSLLDFGRSAVTGVVSAIPDAVALPQTAYAGLKAAYDTIGTENPFLPAFAQNIRMDGSDEKISAKLQQVAQSYKAQQPDMPPEVLQQLVNDYTKTKEFEQFTHGLLTFGPRIAAKTKDYVRSLLGDERTDDARSWTDTAGEVIGGSLVGGPTGFATKIGTKAAGNAVTNALVNNPVSRAALHTAEALTPLTMPYTPANIAINAGAGIALDQAIRAGTGKPTAFSPTHEDDAGIASLGAVAAATGAAAAIAGALHGHGVRQVQQSALDRALANDPALAARVPDYKPGTTNIQGGPPRVDTPTSYVDTLNPARQVQMRGGNRAADEGYIGRQIIEDMNGKPAAEQFEASFSTNTGAALNDAVHANTSHAFRGLNDAFDALPEELKPVVAAGMRMSSFEAHNVATEAKYVKEITDLQAKPTLTNAEQAELTRLQDDLARFRRDDPDARMVLPEVTRQQMQTMARAYETDAHPLVEAVRREHEKLMDAALDVRVKEGKMTTLERQELRQQNRYYVPAVNDPLHGLSGIRRSVESFVQGLKKTDNASGFNVTRESPIIPLEMKIPQPGNVGRIGTPLDPMASIYMYTERNFRDLAHTRMRNQFIESATRDAAGQPTRYMRDGHVERYETPTTHRWSFSNAELGNPHMAHIVNDPTYIPHWQGGKVSFYRFGDPEVTAMLRQDPVVFSGMMRSIASLSKLFKMNTTGVLAPVFGMVNAYYDTSMGMLTHRANRAFGPLSYAAHRILPENVAREIAGRIPDPTALGAVPLHVAMGIADTVRFAVAKHLARDLATLGPIQAIIQRIGFQNYQQAIDRMLIAAERTKTIELVQHGVAFNSALDEATKVRGIFESMKDSVPRPLQTAWNFYTDLVGAIHLAPKRMFYSENFALLERKYGNGRIPANEMEKLIAETRAIAGDMTRRPASKLMKDMDAAFPYLSPVRNGGYHFVRNMTEPGKAEYTLPRLALMLTAVGTSMYMMTYWSKDDKAASDDYWKRTPDWDRWRTIKIPTLDTMQKWMRGEDVPYTRDAVYSLRIAPDLAPVIAGTAAFMQAVGMLPSDASIKPLYKDIPKVFADSVTPAMPPLLQAVLAQSGGRLDPQGSDTRGGSWIRQLGGFRKGPNAESATNLGQVSNSTALMMSALLGANGQYLATAADAFLHASKYEPRLGADGNLVPRSEQQYVEGLKAATNVALVQPVQRLPDVPLLWQGQERFYAGTPAWQAATEAKTHIASIVGMKDDATGKAATRARQLAAQAGGIPPQALADQALVQIAQVIGREDRSGDLGQLKKAYTDLVRQKRAVDANYNIPAKDKQAKSNEFAKQMQANQEQQHLAILHLEDKIAEQFGDALAPRLQGRSVSMQTLDAVMRESFGAPPNVSSEAQSQQE